MTYFFVFVRLFVAIKCGPPSSMDIVFFAVAFLFVLSVHAVRLSLFLPRDAL